MKKMSGCARINNMSTHKLSKNNTLRNFFVQRKGAKIPKTKILKKIKQK